MSDYDMLDVAEAPKYSHDTSSPADDTGAKSPAENEKYEELHKPATSEKERAEQIRLKDEEIVRLMDLLEAFAQVGSDNQIETYRQVAEKQELKRQLAEVEAEKAALVKKMKEMANRYVRKEKGMAQELKRQLAEVEAEKAAIIVARNKELAEKDNEVLKLRNELGALRMQMMTQGVQGLGFNSGEQGHMHMQD